MTKVALKKCTKVWCEEAIEKATRDLLAPLGGMKAFIKKGERVLIKPNYVVPQTKKSGVTTHPLLIKAIAILAREAGAGEIIIGENVGVGYDAHEAFTRCGGQQVADDLNIKLIQNGRKTKRVSFPYNNSVKELDIDETCLDIDCLINVPVMKTHMMTVVSLCLKNLKGCLPHKSMKALHIGGVDYSLVGLYETIKPRLNIIDGTIGHQGMGPINGKPKKADMLIASSDGFAADVLGCYLMGIDINTVTHLTYAAGITGKSLNYNDYEVVGDNIEYLKNEFDPPPTGWDDVYGAHVIAKDACTGCNSTLLAALAQLNDMGQRELVDDISFILGQSVKVPEQGLRDKVFCIGKCLYGQREKGNMYLPGCPPPNWAIIGEIFRSHNVEEESEFRRQRLDFYYDLPADDD